MQNAVGSNKITKSSLSDLKFSNCVDLFKAFQVPRCNFQKFGQVF